MENNIKEEYDEDGAVCVDMTPCEWDSEPSSSYLGGNVRVELGMHWSHKDVLQFLDYYGNEQIIWRTSHPQHRNRNDVQEAWRRIETCMGGKYTIEAMKKKKESLMATFRSCQEKVRRSRRGGELYKPNWYAFESMSRFLKERPRGPRIEEDPPWQPPYNNANGSSDFGYERERDMSNNSSDYGRFCRSNTPNDGNSQFKPPLKRKNNDNEDEEAQKPPKEKNVCEIFGELVSAKLLAMDEDTREMCMHRINNVLFEMRNTSSRTSSACPPPSESPSSARAETPQTSAETVPSAADTESSDLSTDG